MPPFDSLIGLLDSRSFGTIWYWLVVIGIWSLTGRSVIGVPAEIVSRARAALAEGQSEAPVVLHLLDWLSLMLPRWRLGGQEGAVFLGVTGFVLTSLAIMGLGYGLELALATFLLLFPLALLFWLRIALARRLMPLLEAAEQGARPVSDAAAEAVRRMVVHRRWVTALSMAAVAVTAVLGALWAAMHPYGF
ncbi:hypothetical protein EYF88_16175 [Paracoccus sediminis]|uniref:Component of SufBCD complex n=1 Tax=Paracoccus sediminis TaxID=1214787 RepID=A0A238YCE6_9RHOB|nr:hypothetical protein [Paracoccus sediminis]TBN46817.1 hypothetical protein EYF88_16175 [Paracoccus sediminis]SNR68710.1 hypothetical protein SAMN06265378_11717 [Paracoccus sediminis]